MRILMFGAGKTPSTFISRQINEIEKLGFEVTHFPGFDKHKYFFEKLCLNGFTFHVTTSMVEQIKSSHVLHFQWPGHLIKYYALARKWRKPVVLSLRGRQINIMPHLPGQERYVKQLKKYIPLCDAYHGVSRAILDEAGIYGVNSTRAWVIHPAVDTNFFVPKQSNINNPPIITMTGALIWRKGYEYALLAVKKVVEEGYDVQVQIIGDGNELDRLTYAIEDMGLSSKISLLGKQNPEDVRSILQASDIFLHTSLSEGLANVVVEAMACGLPIVTSNAGGLNEAIDHGVEGFLTPVRNVDDVALHLIELLKSQKKRLEMGEAARRRAVKDFDLSMQGRKFSELYRSLT